MKSRPETSLIEIYSYVLANKLTMISPERFTSIDKIAEHWETPSLEGDIIECGCWRGGMSMYLAYAFPHRRV